MSETEYERMFDRWQGIIHEQGRKILDLTARAETAEAEVAKTRQRSALALDALTSAIEAADTGRSPDQERLVLHELRAP